MKPPHNLSFSQRHLGPADRLGEVMFGLIMVLTFTLGAEIIVQEGPHATRTILLGILGSNLAWGFIDGGMYVMGALFNRSRLTRLIVSIQQASNEEEAVGMVERAFNDTLERVAQPAARERLFQDTYQCLRSVQPELIRVRKEDLLGAIASFWLVALTTIPAVIPLLLFDDRFVALRVSNGLVLAILFWIGFRWARSVHSNPWLFGCGLVLSGLVMVVIAIALGG